MFKSLIVALVFISFVTFSVFGLVFMGGHHHESLCPFILGEYVLCSTTIFEHITHWQDLITAVIPFVVLVIASIVVVFRFEYVYVPAVLLFTQRLRRQKTSHFLQELFSSGILNPKAP